MNWRVAAKGTLVGVGLLAASAAPSFGRYCNQLLEPMQAGFSDHEIAERTGLRVGDVAYCRRELSRPILVGPMGPHPHEAIGVPPSGAVGPPPHGAVGRPPSGAVGPAPSSREVRRLR